MQSIVNYPILRYKVGSLVIYNPFIIYNLLIFPPSSYFFVFVCKIFPRFFSICRYVCLFDLEFVLLQESIIHYILHDHRGARTLISSAPQGFFMNFVSMLPIVIFILYLKNAVENWKHLQMKVAQMLRVKVVQDFCAI